MRSFLTVIGVIIGVMTVMVVSSIISGIKVGIEDQIKSTGTNSITLTKRGSLEHGRMNQEQRTRKPLTLADGEALETLSAIHVVAPLLDITFNKKGEKIPVIGKKGNSPGFLSITGTSPSLAQADTEILTEGRWFTKAENEYRKDVALISIVIALDHFPNETAVGKTLEIGGREFRIVGVLEKPKQLFARPGANRKIYIPFNSALRIRPDAEHLALKAIARKGKLEIAQEQIEDLLRTRRHVPYGKPNNFGMRTAKGMIERFNAVSFGVFLAMILISSIGLLIGGIGVMNIMLVSVKERTREIGIRKAVGARSFDILVQFLIEAATLTGIGGILGIGFGWLVTFAISLVFPSYVPPWAPIAGFVASVGIGIVFGLFPAWKAARLDPIECLRYE